MDLPDLAPKTKKKKKDDRPVDDIDWLTFDLRGCTRCPLAVNRCHVVPPKIIPNCDILFISDAPEETEDQFGTEPLIGRTGQKFDELLQMAGIDRNVCSIANVVQCRPPNNREATSDEEKACFHIVERAIKDANPKIIVPLGATALKRITGKKSGITKLNGTVMESPDYPNVKIIPCFHPSYVLRDIRNTEKTVYALKVIKSVLSGNATNSYSNVTYVDTYEKFDAMMKEFEQSTRLSIDIETSGLDFIDDFIIMIAFSCKPNYSYVLPWCVGDDAYYEFCRNYLQTKRKAYADDIKAFVSENRLNMPTYKWVGTDVKERLAKLFKSSSQIKIFHNFKFDVKLLHKAGFEFDRGSVIDTMMASYCLDERVGIHGLKDLAKRYTEYGNYEDSLPSCGLKKTEKKSDSFAIIPPDVLVKYAGTDADATLQVYLKLMPEVIKENMHNLLVNFLMPVSWMLLDVEETGFYIDEKYRQECITRLKQAIVDIDKDLEQYTMIPKDGDVPAPVKFTSNIQLSKYLYEYANLPILDRTEKNDPAVTEEVLEKLAALHPVPKKVLTRRKYAKALSTYFEGITKNIYSDGKVHSSFHPNGTETGRLSSSNPNLQNLTRGTPLLKDIGVVVRDLYSCSRPDDYYLFEVDYSQAELRLIAEYSRDENLYKAFMNGLDPHAMLAVRIYHPELVDQMDNDPNFNAKKAVTKEERQNGKTANFSLCYGKWWGNFAKENNIQEADAKHIYDVYWNTYKGVKRWQQEQVKIALANNNTFITYFGRKRRLANLIAENKHERGEAERQGVNFIIQAQASDYTLLSALKIRNKCKELNIDAKYVSFVHDSIVGEVRKDHAIQLFNTMESIMLHPVGLTIPMEFEIKLGYKLGSCKVVTKENESWKIPT